MMNQICVKLVECPLNNKNKNTILIPLASQKINNYKSDNAFILIAHSHYTALTLTKHMPCFLFDDLLVNQVTVSYFDPSFDKTHHVLILREIK